MGSCLIHPLRFRIVVVALLSLIGLHFASASNAQTRWSAQRQKTPTATSASPAGYVVLGHQKKIAQTRHLDRAWTLGEDGYLIAWRWHEDHWSPVGVERVEQSTALAFEGGVLLVFAPDQITVLHPDGAPQETLAVENAIRCEGDTAWRVTSDQLLCSTTPQGTRRCTDAPVGKIDLRTAVCTRDREMDCMSVRDGQLARGWCTQEDTVTEAEASERASSVLHPENGAMRWLSLTSTGWVDASHHAPPISIRGAQDGIARCFEHQSYERCATHNANGFPESSMVSSRTLRNILTAEHGEYFVFRDGWYGLTREVPPVWDDAQAVRTYDSLEQRVWFNGEVLASAVQDGTAHVAICRSTAGQAEVLEKDLSTGDTRRVTQAPSCPLRADYDNNALVLSYGDRLVRWSLSDHQVREDPIDIALSSVLDARLVAAPSVSRGCPYRFWRVSMLTPWLAETPIARGICAQQAVPLRWDAVDGDGGGAAVLLRGRFGSHLVLVDRDTLATHTLQTNLDIPAHAQIYRRHDGNFFIVDPHQGTAELVDTSGQTLATEALVVIDGRVWREGRGGVLASDDGHQLLATDVGVVLDGVGIGPLAARTVTSDRYLIDRQPRLFSTRVRTLNLGLIPARASR